MRVAQLIDTLEPGGAERMAVSIANDLASQISASILISSRAGGVLKDEISPKVQYFNAARKTTLDVSALYHTSTFIRKQKVSIIHAHGTSYFFAFLIKCLNPSVRIIYHEHFGARAALKVPLVLKAVSRFFSVVVVVNEDLKKWAEVNLYASAVYFVPNYARETPMDVQIDTRLSGIDGKRIVHLANLKEPKNHLVVLKAFASLRDSQPLWTLHLVGTDFNDSYSQTLKDFVVEMLLQDRVFFYGQRTDVPPILQQCSVGVLSSTSEGFPVTLLEYGLAGLSVLTANVGYCRALIKDGVDGLTFDPNDVDQCTERMRLLISDQDLRSQFGRMLKEKVELQYSRQTVLSLLLTIYKSVINER